MDFLRVRLEYESTPGVWVKFHEVNNNVMPIVDGYYTYSVHVNALGDGTWTVRAVVDDDMLETISSNTVSVVVDTTKPVSSITPLGAYWRNTSPITITATASNGLSGVNNVKLYYRFRATNGTAWPTTWNFYGTDTIAPWSWSFTWPSGQGHYQFHSIATDNAGNVEAAPVSPDYDVGYGYDSTNPSAFNLVTPPSPANGASTTNHRPTFDWGTSTDSLSGVHYYQLLVDDSSNFQSPLIDAQTAPSKTDFTSADYPSGLYLSDTTYYWKVRAFDCAGNAKDSTSTWHFTAYTEPTTEPGNVGGIVLQAGGAPLPGATITHVGGAPCAEPGSGNTIFNSGEGNTIYTTVTTSEEPDGSWSMIGIDPGPATITVSKSGYTTETQSLTIPSNGWTYINFCLSLIGGGGTTTGGGNGCLLPNTNISTPNGLVNIEDINEGDIVQSLDERTGIIEPRMAYQTAAHANYPGYLEVNGRLRITANHLIYTTRGLVAATNLSVGDKMMTLAGTEVVASIGRIPELVTVYNFDVEDNHNYFADGILVHNVCTLKEGCPFLYAWNGSSYVEENNILPQATNPDRSQLDVDDYYLIQNGMEPVNGSYSVQIYESALERTHLDDVQLAIIDYDYFDAEPVITANGTLLTIVDPQAPISCIDSSGCEVLELVDNMNDGWSLTAEHNETLTLQFGDLGDFNEARLVIAHKAIIDLLPYDKPLDPRFYKCSIHIQTMDEYGEWHDFASIPARMNKALDAVDITSLKNAIQNGQPIRLLITGTHVIDFIGIDVADSVDFDIEYILPSYASYNNSMDSMNITDLLVQEDQRYAIINPKECIEILFPYKEQLKEHRAMIFISHGHYNTLSEIDIEQPVQISATLNGGSDGVISLFVSEVVDQVSVRDMIGISHNVSDWPNNETLLSFIQDSRERYQLSARFEGCTEETVVTVEVTSFRGSKTIYLEYCPVMGSIAEVNYTLDDVLWNVMGVSFNEYTNHYTVLKDTLLQFDINDWYDGYDTPTWSNYTWNFGDEAWTSDIRPTHVYEALGSYVLNLTVLNSAPGMLFYSDTRIDVVSSPPVPVVEIYQKVNLTLTVSGRKDNTIGVRIYEDGELIQSHEVMRTPGPPNSITIGLNKYLNREYEIELVYDAVHKGSNPTWLQFSSGTTTQTFFKEFNTKYGYYQTILVPECYLDNVILHNPTYWFDASSSYDIDGEIVSCSWDFGDGTTATGTTVMHSYSTSGEYMVTLTITDDDGLVSITTTTITCTIPTGFKPGPPHFPRLQPRPGLPFR